MGSTSMEKLCTDCRSCSACRLCEARTKLVFGDGNENSEVMLVGEGPGEQEDIQGIPFVGRAGKLLDDMLEMIDLDRSKVYIANTVKCRPPHNRDPLDDEKTACRHWLNEQIAIVKPRIIVCLGRIAACELIDKDFKITRDHGRWYELEGRRYTAIYHPSALLRDPARRPETFADLRSIRAEIRLICKDTY